MPQDPIVAKFIDENHVATCNVSDGTRPRWFYGKGDSVRGGTGGSAMRDTLWRGSGNGLQIVISKVEKSSEGVYCCRTSENRRAVEKCFELTVKEPIKFLDTPTEQVADENSTYVVKCEVTGDPTPEIQWKVRGQPVTGLAGSAGARFRPIADGLLIANVSVRDQGHYECAAVQMSEQVTSQQTRNISLRVRHGPKWVKYTESPKYGYITGEVNLTCVVSADPPASIRWYAGQDKQQLAEPLASKVISEENRSTLRVKLSNSTFGKYRCRAKNELGVIQREVVLQQGFKPKPPYHISMKVVSATTATVHVEAHNVGPKVQESTQIKGGTSSSGNSNKSSNVNDTMGYRVRLTRLTNGTEYTFEQDCEPALCRLQGLTPGANYSMRIATLNRAGLSDWVRGPFFETALSAGSAPPAPGLMALAAAVALLLVTARPGRPGAPCTLSLHHAG